MARITVEDCLDHVDNRFELVLLATKRARQVSYGREPMVPLENDKPTVVALREIAAGLVSKSILDDSDNRMVEEGAGGVEISMDDMESVPGVDVTSQAAAAEPEPETTEQPGETATDDMADEDDSGV